MCDRSGDGRFEGGGVKPKTRTTPGIDLEEFEGLEIKTDRSYDKLNSPSEETGTDDLFPECEKDESPLEDIQDPNEIYDAFIKQTRGKIPSDSISSTQVFKRDGKIKIEHNVFKDTPGLKGYKMLLKKLKIFDEPLSDFCCFKYVSEKDDPRYEEEEKSSKPTISRYPHGDLMYLDSQTPCNQVTYGGPLSYVTDGEARLFATIPNHMLSTFAFDKNLLDVEAWIVMLFQDAPTNMAKKRLGHATNVLNIREIGSSAFPRWSDIGLLEIETTYERYLPKITHNGRPVEIDQIFTNFDRVNQLEGMQVFFNGAMSGSVTSKVHLAHRNSSLITKGNDHARGTILLWDAASPNKRAAVEGDSGAWVWFIDPKTNKKILIGSIYGGGYYNGKPVAYCPIFAYANRFFVEDFNLDFTKMLPNNKAHQPEGQSSGYSSCNTDDTEAGHKRNKRTTRCRYQTYDIEDSLETRTRRSIVHRTEEPSVRNNNLIAPMTSNDVRGDASESSGYESDAFPSTHFVNEMNEDLSITRIYFD